MIFDVYIFFRFLKLKKLFPKISEQKFAIASSKNKNIDELSSINNAPKTQRYLAPTASSSYLSRKYDYS